MTSYSPEAVAERCGIPADTIRRIAAELAHVAFEQTIELPVAVDRLGRAPSRDDARAARSRCMRCAASRPIPTAFTPAAPSTCCRCCSARSMCPAASASSRPTPSRAPPGRKPSGKDGGQPNTPLDGMPLGFVSGPDDLLVDEAGTPLSHRQGLFLGRAARRARPDAHRDPQCRARRSRTRSTRCSCTWRTWRGTRR